MKQPDMGFDGSRQRLQDDLDSVLEALSRSGVTIERHSEYGYQWTLDSGMWGRADTIADAVETGIYNLIAHDT